MSKFELWLELETGEPLDQEANRPTENFCNISVSLEDGRRFALNVWTFDFLPLARFEFPYAPSYDAAPSLYVLPPDLFVERLDRKTIEKVISEMIDKDEMQDRWLCVDAK